MMVASRKACSVSCVLLLGLCVAAAAAGDPPEGFVSPAGELKAEAVGGEESVKAVALIDDFELGFSPNWTDGSGGGTAAIEIFGADGTDHSMRIDGGTGAYDMWYDMFPWQPTSVTVFVRSSSTSADDAYVVIGDANTRYDNGAIFFFAEGNSEFTVAYDHASYSCGFYNPFTWYRIDFTVDWACKVFDVYVDGSLKQFNLPFRNPGIEEFSQFHALNFDDSTAWWDQITMRSPAASLYIFGDGFERASTCRWSATVN